MSSNPLDNKSQAWSALFSEPMSELVQRYTASVGFDQRLAAADIAGSLAHAEMLAAQGVISADDHAAIQRGMAPDLGRHRRRALRVEARARGRAPEHRGAADATGGRRGQAPAHRALAQRPGGHRRAPVAARRDRPPGAAAGRACSAPWWLRPNRTRETILPGFTHLQVAQPVSFAHHLLAYVEMFARDAERLADVRKRVNRLPLGAAALAGTSYPLDRERVATHAGLRRRVRQQPGRRQRPRLRDRVHGLGRDHDDACVAPEPRRSCSG